jgi:hypothetical protein
MTNLAGAARRNPDDTTFVIPPIEPVLAIVSASTRSELKGELYLDWHIDMEMP